MKRLIVLGALIALVIQGQPAWGQEVERLVARADDGFVRMTFTPRLGICGNGNRYNDDRFDPHWDSGGQCTHGPVHVLLTKDEGRITHLKTYVGGQWRALRGGTTDIGRVGSPEAARYLLGLAQNEPVGHRAIMPATFADSIEVWRLLLDMARDSARPRLRKESMQWLGMLAGRELSDDDSVDPDREWRRQAVFALSQLPKDEGIPRLIQLVRSHRYDYIKRLALFWLGQSGDSRAFPVMEAVFGN
jgi:hypothetical protein